MKFIKCQNGYAALDNIETLRATNWNAEYWYIRVLLPDDAFRLGTFNSKAEAQKYLDDLVEKLEAENERTD